MSFKLNTMRVNTLLNKCIDKRALFERPVEVYSTRKNKTFGVEIVKFKNNGIVLLGDGVELSLDELDNDSLIQLCYALALYRIKGC